MAEELRAFRPHYGIRCRSLGGKPGQDPTRDWVISALDGFVNYSLGLPHWAMTVSLVHKGNPVLSVIFNPLENELFTAEEGGGSWLNNTRIRASKKIRLSEFAAGTEPIAPGGGLKTQIKRVRKVAGSVSSVRAFGSASLDLASVSCGRLDAFWTDSRPPSSLPAAALLVAEAGGLMETLDDPESDSQGLVAAGNAGFGVFASLARGDGPAPERAVTAHEAAHLPRTGGGS